MRYALLIHWDQDADPGTEAEQAARHEAYGACTESYASAGILRDGAGLQPATSATTVRVRDGRTLSTDGPFAETKEQLGGYYVIDVDDLDAAIEAASRIPAVGFGSIEVRPLMEFG